MTKRRNPLTFELALTRVASEIGWGAAAKIVGQAERTVRKWSDPDVSAKVSMDSALALDCAYRAAGGDGAPFLQCYAVRLEAEAAIACADSRVLADKTATAAKEVGEAVAALIRASQPGAASADRVIAQRETEEAINALTNTLPNLGAGPGTSVSTQGEKS